METKGIERKFFYLIERLKEIYEETSNLGRKLVFSEEFWTREGVRQGCVLSPTLFILFLADIEEELAREQCSVC